MPGTPDPEPLTDGPARRPWVTSIEFAALAGIVCAVAWSAGLRGLLDQPGLDASHAEIERFYAEPGAGATAPVLLALMVVGTVAYLWFVGVVRARLGARESRLVGTVFLGGSLLVTGLLLLGASALAAPSILVAVGGQAPDPGGTALLRALAAVVLSVFSARVATLVMFAMATLARQTGALPRWVVLVTYVAGIVEFVSITLWTPTLFIFPAWIALVSVTLLIRPPEPTPAAAHREV